jgi:hypothetical protein
MDALISWLLESDPWVSYRTRLELLGESENSLGVQQARAAMLADARVQGLQVELSGWPGQILNSHKSAGHPLHKLVFLADLGLKADDPGMSTIIERVMEHPADTGPFQVLMNISPHYGGTGEDVWAWAPCDAPLILYALVQFGLGADEGVRKGVEYLVGLCFENGWRCTTSPELGKFRGPGKKDDPCPFATLIMLKTLALLPDYYDSPAAHTGAETLLHCWTERRDQHPYMFFMGTDFSKLKAPLVWYDILNLTDVLSRFTWLRNDPRLLEMVDIIRAKANEEGRFIPESIWTAWKDWDFGQKKQPSPGLTLLVNRIFSRLAH